MPGAQKAAIYCRVSTVHQVDKDSLPMQRQDMVNYARYVLGIEDYEVKDFINTVVSHIVVLDGRVTQIAFINGETHTFLY